VKIESRYEKTPKKKKTPRNQAPASPRGRRRGGTEENSSGNFQDKYEATEDRQIHTCLSGDGTDEKKQYHAKTKGRSKSFRRTGYQSPTQSAPRRLQRPGNVSWDSRTKRKKGERNKKTIRRRVTLEGKPGTKKKIFNVKEKKTSGDHHGLSSVGREN